MQSLSETKKPEHPAPQCRPAPLCGIRIIDFGHYIAGPLTGMLLADQGAEVFKIDRPGSNDLANLATSCAFVYARTLACALSPNTADPNASACPLR